MVSITYHPISDVDFEAFTAAFNLAYSDYFVPISMTSGSFRALMERDDLAPEFSVAALDGDKIVGTGLLGLRAPLSWIGGMGVIPEYRRQGIGRAMMQYLMMRARELRLAKIALEVIEMNTGAHTLYRDLGFVAERYLLILEREPAPLPEHPTPYTIEEVPTSRALRHYQNFHDVHNCWQRAQPSLQALADHAQSWVALDGTTVLGYIIGWANEFGIRLLDIATDPACDRVAVAHMLLAHLHHRFPTAHASSYNIAENDPLVSVFAAIGYDTRFRQIEMGLQLGE